MKVEFLIPEGSGDALEEMLELLGSTRLGLPFNDAAVEFVGELSRGMLADRGYRQYPELVALAHWFRPANLAHLKAEFVADQRHTGGIVPRGLVFHIAPSNVDSVFIYSWLLSLLCANSNIVRVSQRRTPQLRHFVATANSLLGQDRYRALARANVVVSYDHDATITSAISRHSQLRVVWGGDATVSLVRAIPLPPLSGELVFANRFSLAVIKSEAVLGLAGASLRELARHFCNDAFWFNQQACSSPRAVVWIGSVDYGRQAQSAFWQAVGEAVRERSLIDRPAQVLDRTTTMFRYAHAHAEAISLTPPGAFPSRILLDSITSDDRDCHDGNGLFIELYRSGLAEIVGLLRSGDQTIAHFGFDRADWLPLLPLLPPHAADRIVTIGQALAFSTVWDGQNLLRSFTREIYVQGI